MLKTVSYRNCFIPLGSHADKDSASLTQWSAGGSGYLRSFRLEEQWATVVHKSSPYCLLLRIECGPP